MAFPTETVYGLGADALDPGAVERVFRTKGRPATNPVIVHVDGAEMARTVTSDWPRGAAELADRFWPGPLTLVLDRSELVPDIVTAGGRTVGVRCPDHDVARELISGFGGPLIGPSANASGTVSPTAARHVVEGFGGAVPVIDGGVCRVGIESTVLDLSEWGSGGGARIIRPGSVSAAAIGETLGQEIATGPGPALPGSPARSPGQMARHYAPRARLIVFEPEDWPGVAGDVELAGRKGPAGRIVLMTHDLGRFAPPPNVTYHMPDDPDRYAHQLYGTLRAADALEPGLILIERVPAGEAWDALRDRIGRAAAEPGD